MDNIIMTAIPMDQLLESFREVARQTFREEIEKTSAKEKNENRMVSRKRAAEYLGISLPTLNRRLNEGQITRHIIGGSVRIDLNEVDAILRKSC